MNRMAKRAIMLAIVLVALVVLPVAAMAVDVDSYDEFAAAVLRGETDINITGDFTVTMETDSWIRPYLSANCHINGNGHTITLDYLYNGNNGNYLFYTNGNCLIENIIFDGSNLRRGERVASITSGDTLKNVTIIGNSTMTYGVTASGDDVTITDCKIKNVRHAIYTSESNPAELTITGSKFEDCNYVTILRKDDSEFSNNTVVNGKLNVLGSSEVTGNTFEGKSRIKFYYTKSAEEFSGNMIMDDSYIEVETQEIIDLGDKNHDNYYEDFDTAFKGISSELKSAARDGSICMITVKDALNGTVSAPATAKPGESVKLTVKPDTGYVVKAIKTNISGVMVTDNTFTMPASDISITVEFEIAPSATSSMPQTGDNSNLALFALLLTMSAAGMLLLMRRKGAQE